MPLPETVLLRMALSDARDGLELFLAGALAEADARERLEGASEAISLAVAHGTGEDTTGLAVRHILPAAFPPAWGNPWSALSAAAAFFHKTSRSTPFPIDADALFQRLDSLIAITSRALQGTDAGAYRLP